MGLGGVTIAALHAVMCLEVPFSDGLGGYCAAGNPFNLLRLHSVQVLTHNLCRCQSRAPDGCVVSLPDATIRHVIHVIAFVPGLSRKSVSSDNKFQDRKKA